MLKNLEKYLKPLPKTGRTEVKSDIQALQASKDLKTFSKGASLFVKKWSKIYPELVTYFKCEWLDKNYQWYEGAAKSCPSSNNTAPQSKKGRARSVFFLKHFQR